MSKIRVVYPLVMTGIFIDRPAEGTYSEDDLDIVPDSVVSDYEGDFGGSLEAYVAPTPVQEYKVALITRTEWRDLLTLTEQILSDKVKSSIEGDLSYLTDIDVDSILAPGVTNRDILRTGFTAFGDAETLEISNLTVQLVTNTMVVVGILATQERAVTVLKGVPL